jgi:hypothetical protein
MSSGRSTSASKERVEEVEGSVVGTGIQRKQGQLTEFVGSSVLIATAVKRTGEREVIGVASAQPRTSSSGGRSSGSWSPAVYVGCGW